MQVASALDYLHRHPLGICNRDVKPENVLVVTFEPHADDVQRPVCKLADFGFSKALSSREPATRLGTAFYVAPEIYLLKTCVSGSFTVRPLLFIALFAAVHDPQHPAVAASCYKVYLHMYRISVSFTCFLRSLDPKVFLCPLCGDWKLDSCILGP